METHANDQGQKLDAAEVHALRAALGLPNAEQVRTAVEEVERQVAIEDLVVLMVEAVQETVRAFFDFLVHLDLSNEPITTGDAKEKKK